MHLIIPLLHQARISSVSLQKDALTLHRDAIAGMGHTIWQEQGLPACR